MNLRTTFCILMLAGITASCAVKEESNANYDAKMYFDAWMKIHHPDAVPSGAGIYIIENSDGDGKNAVTVPGYAMVTYTIRDIEGNVSSTSDSTVAKQLGEFNESYYYGPNVWTMTANTVYRGVEDMMTGMTVGGKRTAIIPGWLLTYNRYASEDEFISNAKDTNPKIYTVELKEVTDDIIKWQIDSMGRYVSEQFGIAPEDSLGYGFYYKRLSEPESDADIRKDTTIYINYTGKLLNGQVFDTTLENVAKDNNIYSASKTYGPVSVTMSSDSTAVTMNESSIITGFARTIWQMKPMERGVGIFYSSLGYGYSGSGSMIPAYAPLVFEIELTADPEEED